MATDRRRWLFIAVTAFFCLVLLSVYRNVSRETDVNKALNDTRSELRSVSATLEVTRQELINAQQQQVVAHAEQDRKLHDLKLAIRRLHGYVGP